MHIQRGFLYLADLSPRVGSDDGKIRPVLVIQSDLLNEQQHYSTWILPCTTNVTKENILRVRLSKDIAGNLKECDVMIDQSRAIDNTRFKSKLGALPAVIMKEVERKLLLCCDLLRAQKTP